MKLLLSNNEIVEINTRKDVIKCFLDHPTDKNCLNLLLPSYENKDNLYKTLSFFYNHQELDGYERKSIRNIILEKELQQCIKESNPLLDRLFSENTIKKSYFNRNNLNFVKFKYNNSTNSVVVSGLLFKDFKKAITENDFAVLNNYLSKFNRCKTDLNPSDNYTNEIYYNSYNSTRRYSSSDKFLLFGDIYSANKDVRDVCAIIINLIETHYSFCTTFRRSDKSLKIYNFLDGIHHWYDNYFKTIPMYYINDVTRYCYDIFSKINEISLESYVENVFDTKKNILNNLSKIAVKDYVKLDLPDFLESSQATDRYKPIYKAIDSINTDTVNELNKSLEKVTSNIDNTISTILKHFSSYYKDDEHIKIVDGFEIAKYYNSINYAFSNGTLGSSCMRHNGFTNEHTEVYCLNPDVCKMIVYCDEKDKTLARAILWYTNGRIYLDRIFCSDTLYAKKIAIYANNHNFIGLYDNHIDGIILNESINGNTIHVDLKPLYYNMPYLDSMTYYDILNHRLSNRKIDDNFVNCSCHNAGCSHMHYIDSYKSNIVTKHVGFDKYDNAKDIYHPFFGYIPELFWYDKNNPYNKNFLDLKLLYANKRPVSAYSSLYTGYFKRIPYIDSMLYSDKYCLLTLDGREFYFIGTDTINDKPNQYHDFVDLNKLTKEDCSNVQMDSLSSNPLTCKVQDFLLCKKEGINTSILPKIVFDRRETDLLEVTCNFRKRFKISRDL